MSPSKLKVGDVVRAVLEDHCVPTLGEVDFPHELTFEVFGRVVRLHARSMVLQTWGNLPNRRGVAVVDENTEFLRILKRDVVSLRRLK